MANMLLPAGGALVGSMFGQTGAALGWMLGSAFSSSNNEETSQDTLADLQVQTSQYGVSIPLVVGRQRVAGNIIWAADKVKYENQDSFTGHGKGGDTKKGAPDSPPGYTISMLIAICQGPILGISRVWSDGNLIINSGNLIGTLYNGSMTQTADPVYAAAVGGSNAPAYRGLAYIALHDYDLGVSGRIPQFSFEVVKQGIL